MSVTKTFNFRIRVEDKELSYYLELPGGKTGPGFEELRMAIAQEVQEEICNVDDYFITCKNVTEGAHKEVLKSDIVLRRALRHLLEDEVLEVTLIKRRAKPMHDFFGKHEKQEVPKTIYSVSVSSNRPSHNVQQTSTTISDEGDARIPWTPATNGLPRVNDVESLGFTQMPKQLLNAQTQTTSPQVTKKCSQFLATENEKGESSRPVLAATSWRLSQTVSRWLQNYEGSTMPQGTTGNVDEEPKHNTVISSRRFVGSEGGKLVRAHTLEPPHSNSHSPLHRSTRLSTQKPNDIDHRDLKRQRRQLSNSIPATVVHPRPKDPFLTQLPISFAPGEHYFVYKWAQVWESLGGSGTGTRVNLNQASARRGMVPYMCNTVEWYPFLPRSLTLSYRKYFEWAEKINKYGRPVASSSFSQVIDARAVRMYVRVRVPPLPTGHHQHADAKVTMGGSNWWVDFGWVALGDPEPRAWDSVPPDCIEVWTNVGKEEPLRPPEVFMDVRLHCVEIKGEEGKAWHPIVCNGACRNGSVDGVSRDAETEFMGHFTLCTCLKIRATGKDLRTCHCGASDEAACTCAWRLREERERECEEAWWKCHVDEDNEDLSGEDKCSNGVKDGGGRDNEEYDDVRDEGGANLRWNVPWM